MLTVIKDPGTGGYEDCTEAANSITILKATNLPPRGELAGIACVRRTRMLSVGCYGYRDRVNRSGTVPATALMQIPPWLWGGNPSDFFAQAKLRGRLVNAAAGSWRVQTEESWRRTRSSMITVSHLAGPMMSRPRFEIIQRMARSDTPSIALSDHIIEEINRLGRRAQETGKPADAIAHSQMQIMAVQSNELPDVVRGVYENLLDVGLVGDTSEKVFANAGVHIFHLDPALVHRLKMASAWLRVSADQQLGLGDLSQIQAAAKAGENIFASSQGLYDGIYTFDAYIGPLLGALSPAVWSFNAVRALGTIVYTLGQPLAGTQGTAAELLHVLPNQGAYESTAVPTLSPNASTMAINWWADRLNELFVALGDPAVYTDQTGSYVPAKHLHTLMTVEQLFRRVSSIQTSHRDSNARKTLLFTVLDTLERLTGRDLPALCSLTLAQKTFGELSDNIPGEAAEVLLPGAQRAVTALEKVQKGFFIQRQTGASHIEWIDPRTGPCRLTPTEATAQYIKILRDSTHGHGSNRANQAARTNALLTHHNGKIPHDLALLGYLYLLDLISRPGDLRLSLHQRGKT